MRCSGSHRHIPKRGAGRESWLTGSAGPALRPEDPSSSIAATSRIPGRQPLSRRVDRRSRCTWRPRDQLLHNELAVGRAQDTRWPDPPQPATQVQTEQPERLICTPPADKFPYRTSALCRHTRKRFERQIPQPISGAWENQKWIPALIV